MILITVSLKFPSRCSVFMLHSCLGAQIREWRVILIQTIHLSTVQGWKSAPRKGNRAVFWWTQVWWVYLLSKSCACISFSVHTNTHDVIRTRTREWKHDKQDGFGTFFWTDGRKYEGQWVADKRCCLFSLCLFSPWVSFLFLFPLFVAATFAFSFCIVCMASIHCVPICLISYKLFIFLI